MRYTERKHPAYDLVQARQLVAAGKFDMTSRITRFIRNHWDDRPRAAVTEIFEALEPQGFYKSVELEFDPGTMADVYFADFEGERWYVKYYIRDGAPVVQMLSCNIDGFDH